MKSEHKPLIPLDNGRVDASSKRPSLPLLVQELCGLKGPKPIKPAVIQSKNILWFENLAVINQITSYAGRKQTHKLYGLRKR